MQFSWTKVEPINTVRYSYSPSGREGRETSNWQESEKPPTRTGTRKTPTLGQTLYSRHRMRYVVPKNVAPATLL
jgi:hypothetical protein